MMTFEPQPFSTPGRTSISPVDVILYGPPLAAANIARDDLHANTNAFLARFDAFISEGKQQIQERKQRWLNGVGEDRGALLCVICYQMARGQISLIGMLIILISW